MKKTESGLSRREFLRSASAGAVSLAASGLLGGVAHAEESSAEAIYTPGTYTATATGMGEVTVTITFDETSITDVVVDVSNETETIGQLHGETLKEAILAAQSADIDGVSGATVTSDAVKEAAANCIAQAMGVSVEEISASDDTEETSWKTAPEHVSESEITATYESDVLVIGRGHGGIACARELAESRVSVILLENQVESVYSAMGNAAGCINSEYLLNKGVTEVDPVEFYTNWQLNTNNGANPKMAMNYAQHSGEYVDWFITELATDEEMATTSTQYIPLDEERRENMLSQIGHHKFWSSSIDLYGDLNMTEIHKRNHTKITENGGQIFFATKAQYLLQDEDGTVTGAVAKTNGEYVQYNAKVVVIATGGFGGNQEMMKDLLPDLVDALQEGDELSKMGMDRDGSGIAMGYWAGAALEHTVATMDGRTPWIGGSPGLSLSVGHPQGMWMNEDGKRFMNEYWGPIEFRSRPLMRMNRDRFYCVYDSNLPENLTYVAPNHGTKDPTYSFLENVQAAMDAAVEAGSAGYEVPDPSMFWYGAETLEEVVSFIDADDKVKQNILDSVERYNELCEAGKDEDFGREPELMFPIKDGPFFLQVTDHDSSVGNLMCTMGGLITDGDQRVLALSDWRPIPGLFATGNCTGGRFGDDYFTPLFGASIGMCITLGRDCGKAIVKYLNDEL
ncbi:MAG: FAD-dependent oxidoreductase [Lachnospiraceae bacterium]|nr:FAD-dependent oxidoreductase [Lachnospiraceae bacterium]